MHPPRQLDFLVVHSFVTFPFSFYDKGLLGVCDNDVSLNETKSCFFAQLLKTKFD